jgi:hypothetical protein
MKRESLVSYIYSNHLTNTQSFLMSGFPLVVWIRESAPETLSHEAAGLQKLGLCQ